jgi:hypothetical protein
MWKHKQWLYTTLQQTIQEALGQQSMKLMNTE